MLRDESDADDYYRSKILAAREVERFLETHPDFWAAMVLPGWMHGPGDMGPTSAGQTVLDFAKGNSRESYPAPSPSSTRATSPKRSGPCSNAAAAVSDTCRRDET